MRKIIANSLLKTLAFPAIAWSIVGCSSTAKTPDGENQVHMPEPLEYVETEDTIFLVNYTCFKLAEKTKKAFDIYRKRHEKNQQALFISTIDCTSGPQGKYAFVSMSFSVDEFDSSKIMTGPTIFATTSDNANTFKWSTWQMGMVPH